MSLSADEELQQQQQHTLEEAAWLLKYPHFRERPASYDEFLGPDYLNIEGMVRLAVNDVLHDMIGHEVNPWNPTAYPFAIFTGGIGIGKTTVASIVLPYLVHWVLCLKDPYKFFELLPGSRIAFMQMSTSEDQAKEVVFGDIKARIENSPWFKRHPHNPKYTSSFRWEEKLPDGKRVDVWILPGDSTETSFEGYNILGGVLDEADSHKVTETKDYADVGFETISMRMTSRFEDKGFVLIIGQMKKATGFAARKLHEFQRNPKAYAVRMSIWESRGDAFYRCKKEGPHEGNQTNKKNNVCGQVHKFAFDPKRKKIIPAELGRTIQDRTIMFIPETYRDQFEANPEKALKDLAGIPPIVGDAFISLDYKIEEARDRWIFNQISNEMRLEGLTSPVTPEAKILPWFKARDKLKRAVHVDIGYASEGDALGIVMGHVPRVVTIGGETKPYIVIDFMMRMTAPAGGEIFLGNMRQVLYTLKDTLGFNITSVTLDGFQSQDTIQQLRRRRFRHVDYLSVDKEKLPYEDLREAIYEDRIEIPQLMSRFRAGETEFVEIAYKELSELIDTGIKIDHPEYGSKDVADGIAGVTYRLMGDRRYQNKSTDLGNYRASKEMEAANGGGMGISHPAFMGGRGMSAPVPPQNPWSNR